MFLRRRSARTLLREPAPQVIFVEFGDSSINFELRAWTDEIANAIRIRTLYDSSNEAGMSFPFPQREVRLLSDLKAGSPMASADVADAKNGGDSSAQREGKRPENEPENKASWAE
jgi:potassium-dependent mechanosensitive channel